MKSVSEIKRREAEDQRLAQELMEMFCEQPSPPANQSSVLPEVGSSGSETTSALSGHEKSGTPGGGASPVLQRSSELPGTQSAGETSGTHGGFGAAGTASKAEKSLTEELLISEEQLGEVQRNMTVSST